ncbi:ATP/GTP-binding protein [Actinoallomurus sp. NBC_01490]|jgi:signal recognition particle receptor subunit beta|uniref:GTP-binding protein n=1 Tax=Actinoallomurus sp. NBC_01490 TaxID=2903557 RepID=UPI002E36E1C0|nr:ATP/GTP-binding protein [Actinoallomurus sp. NBC_01490]
MSFTPFEPQADARPRAIKILIAGGFGAGKTTLVGTASEIRPLRTESGRSSYGRAIDGPIGVDSKESTTVAMDFGRVTLPNNVMLYLFGTPGQRRFWFMWDGLARGAAGAIVLADTRRLPDCFGAIDYFEQRGTPFVVAVNCFDSAPRYGEARVRVALDLDPGVPIIMCDARSRESVIQVLIAVVAHALRLNGSFA